MALEIFGLAIVNAGRIEPDRFDGSILYQPRCRRRVQAREMQERHRFRAALGRPKILLCIGIKFTVTGAEQYNSSVWNTTIAAFPCQKVVGTNQVIPVRQGFFRNINYHRTPLQAIHWNLVAGPAGPGKVDRCIEVSTPIPVYKTDRRKCRFGNR